MNYTYETIADIVRLSKEHNCSFAEVVLRNEMATYEMTKEEVLAKIDERLAIFEESVQAGLEHTGKTVSGMSGGQGLILEAHKPLLLGELAYKAMTYALVVNEANAKMFRIVACPTAGSCGVLPGCVKAVKEVHNIPHELVQEAFLVAAGIGNVVAERACV
ncbi:MAG: L-serine ammonia-lyase, iron-sulfur-dependent, subunit alpha, partial [Veillonella sp.]|nr:L-serine ammonia-lyase, iron-sulfur-dependent, subunit alpha [Veillonella sp.]